MDTYGSKEGCGPFWDFGVFERLESDREPPRSVLFLDIALEIQGLWDEQDAVYLVSLQVFAKVANVQDKHIDQNHTQSDGKMSEYPIPVARALDNVRSENGPQEWSECSLPLSPCRARKLAEN